jgi:hypothetical protein
MYFGGSKYYWRVAKHNPLTVSLLSTDKASCWRLVVLLNRLLFDYKNNETVYVRHIIFNEWEAACFGPYRTIIRPSYESSQ